ncbi:olfactory receptor 52D1-like [Dermochelys coriacea]|uniref:olfactory receptor 52D1-like n=1 Tax=Dermochelys coriacea TaxID=27794 RepID=UPI001CA80F33|nr:olfactory receptor 52D1-like [Dermochelys coriacea]
MSAINSTDIGSHLFILLGIPGLEAAHIWISVPLCSMYIASLSRNTGVLVVRLVERSLQQPKYLFLSMLASSDLILSSTTVPKMLLMLWFKAGEISFAACFTQMFFVHAVFALESAILLAMSFDRYVATSDPLRYRAVVTKPLVRRIGVASILRRVCVVLPFVLFLKRLPYCGHHIVHHAYCEHMGIVQLACANITVIIAYGLIVTFSAIGLDIIFITVSYALILRAVF